jgi:threonine dehydratase
MLSTYPADPASAESRSSGAPPAVTAPPSIVASAPEPRERTRADVDPLDPRDGLLSDELLDSARRRVGEALPATPLLLVPALGAYLKLESHQVTGAFKVRGALNALAARVERGERRAVVAASAGNHALGVAWAARRLGISATVVVPDGAPATKVSGARALGARVVTGGASYDTCAEQAQALAHAEGWGLVHPFDDAEVIAGQATVASEILDELVPDVVLVPVGGGGLAAGAGSVLRRRGVRVVGVQVQGMDAMRRALAGDDSARSPATSLADGLRVRRAGRLTTAVCRRALDDVVLVSEDMIREAIRALHRVGAGAAEGAGAVAVAALSLVPGRRRVAIVSGRNIDDGALAGVLGPA